MRAIMVGLVLTVAGCAAEPPAAPLVSWQYGADGVAYPAPAGTFTWNGDGVQSTPTAATTDTYGPNGMAGTMVQTAPAAPSQMLAAPTPAPKSTQPGDHT